MDEIHNKVLAHWNEDQVESMYDKHLLRAEIEMIKQRIPEGAAVLDVGCGEGEGTLVYASVSGVEIRGIDFSDTRLRKATERLAGHDNVTFQQVNLLEDYTLDAQFDIAITQRCLINLLEWPLQLAALKGLLQWLKPGGRLIMLEGSKPGVDALNKARAAFGMDPIPVRWHNLFFDDAVLVEAMEREGCKLIEEDGLGAYFLLTRGVRPALDTELNWDCAFNERAASPEMARALGLGAKFSRLKLWVFQK